MKVVAGRPRDIEDVRGIILKNPKFDRTYIVDWLAQFDEGLNAQFSLAFEQLLAMIKKGKRSIIGRRNSIACFAASRAVVAVAAEFDVDAASVADFGQRLQARAGSRSRPRRTSGARGRRARMSSMWTLTSRGAQRRITSAIGISPWQCRWPMSSVSRKFGWRRSRGEQLPRTLAS